MSQTERVVFALPFVPKTMKDTADDPVLRQVAGYARVSTSEEEQQNSYEAQIDITPTTSNRTKDGRLPGCARM